MVFSVKNSFIAFALVAKASAQGPKLNISDACREAKRATFRPSTADCSWGSQSTAELDKFCGNLDKCIEWAKQTVQDGCKEEISNPNFKFGVDFHLPMTYKGVCLKDSKGEYCKIRRNATGQCNDCNPKKRELIVTVLANAPQDKRDKIIGMYDKRNPCNGTEKDQPMKMSDNSKVQTKQTSGSSVLSATSLALSATALLSTFYAVNTL
jgi:hypothetical protein